MIMELLTGFRFISANNFNEILERNKKPKKMSKYNADGNELRSNDLKPNKRGLTTTNE